MTNEMDIVIKDVANRIKDLREIFNISPEEMGYVTDTTPEQYLEMEKGETDFNFTFIFKCAQRFGVEVTDILKGSSPTLSSFSVTRKGEGVPIARRQGFSYKNLASLFKNKVIEPFSVVAPYAPENETMEIPVSIHEGQEFDIITSGCLRTIVDGHEVYLYPGDTIYYDSTSPHGMVAVGGEDCLFTAIVINPHGAYHYEAPTAIEPAADKYVRKEEKQRLYNNFTERVFDENGVLQKITFKNDEHFNFAFDVMDILGERVGEKTAMIYVDNDKNDRLFTFKELADLSSQAANYFADKGIKKGDKVMLILKRHYQFWIALLGLHKIGAVAIPAVNQLLTHDITYRFNKAHIKAIICTPDGDTADCVDEACKECPQVELKFIVNGSREGWLDFDSDLTAYSTFFPRPQGEHFSGGSDPMLMYFTSGTTGFPKLAVQNHFYALAQFVTAKYWHNVNPDGLHFTISDTGWTKAMWGKSYGQWMCEAAFFVYDFDRFHAEDILPMFSKYNITTFCAPPTMYRFFIKEDLTKYDLSSIEYASTAGEALNLEVSNRFYDATGIRVKEGFGQTETTVVIGNLAGASTKLGSMGRTIPIYDVAILRPDGTEADLGETGEICISTKNGVPHGLFCGYYEDEAKTAECWHDGYYHTGDTAWKDQDNFFWYVGRIDDVIKSSGYRIGPFEIESVIMELPYILECAVTGAPDPIRGQVVKATIVLKGAEPSEELKKEIQNYVKTHTAPYKYPRLIDFVDELPKTSSGKIKRIDLRHRDGIN